MTSGFDAWAHLYDSVYSYVKEDIPFYVEEARKSGGPVLELACGTGRVSIPIAGSGVDVVGLDSSEAMIEVASTKARRLTPEAGSLTLVRADMRDFSLDPGFRLVVVPFRGFLSLLTVEDQIAALLNVKRHMRPGARLVFNIFVPDPDMLVQDSDVAYHLRDVTDPDSGARYVLWHQSSYDNHNQVVSTRVVIEELDQGGTMTRRTYRDFQLRYSHRWEMEHLLTRCGFKVIDLFGDFNRSPFDETSLEMVWVVGLAG